MTEYYWPQADWSEQDADPSELERVMRHFFYMRYAPDLKQAKHLVGHLLPKIEPEHSHERIKVVPNKICDGCAECELFKYYPDERIKVVSNKTVPQGRPKSPEEEIRQELYNRIMSNTKDSAENNPSFVVYILKDVFERPDYFATIIDTDFIAFGTNDIAEMLCRMSGQLAYRGNADDYREKSHVCISCLDIMRFRQKVYWEDSTPFGPKDSIERGKFGIVFDITNFFKPKLKLDRITLSEMAPHSWGRHLETFLGLSTSEENQQLLRMD